jgi:hypothetical protein
MSEFDEFAAGFAVPAMQEQFGDPERLLMRPAGGQSFLVDAIFGTPRFTQEYDPVTGDVRRVERVTAQIATDQFPDTMTAPEREMEVIEMHSTAGGNNEAGREWAVDLDATQWGAAIVVLGLMRSPLAAQGELRRGQ